MPSLDALVAVRSQVARDLLEFFRDQSGRLSDERHQALKDEEYYVDPETPLHDELRVRYTRLKTFLQNADGESTGAINSLEKRSVPLDRLEMAFRIDFEDVVRERSQLAGVADLEKVAVLNALVRRYTPKAALVAWLRDRWTAGSGTTRLYVLLPASPVAEYLALQRLLVKAFEKERGVVFEHRAMDKGQVQLFVESVQGRAQVFLERGGQLIANHRLILALTIAIALAALGWYRLSPPTSSTVAPVPAAPPAFAEMLVRNEWIAYEPTHYDPYAPSPIFPSEDDVRKDLEKLKSFGFSGIITFRSEGIQHVPVVARRLGLKVIQGVDLSPPSVRNYSGDQTRIDQAVKREIARAVDLKDLVEAYAVGHNPRNPPGPELFQLIGEVRRMTRKPVTTTNYLEQYDVIQDHVEWLFPDIGVQWRGGNGTAENELRHFEEAFKKASQKASQLGKPVLLKTVSFPSGGQYVDRKYSPYTDVEQDKFFDGLLDRMRRKGEYRSESVAVSYYLAFDAPFKAVDGDPAEPFLGLFVDDEDRQRKHAACRFVTISPEQRFGWVFTPTTNECTASVK